MNWATDLIADMYGPKFLASYGAAGLVVICISWWWARRRPARADEAGDREGLSQARLTAISDPYRVAFLKGGAVGVIHLAVIELLRKGWLEISTPLTKSQGSHQLRQAESVPATTPSKIEYDVWKWFDAPRSAPGLLSPQSGIVPAIESHCAGYADDAIKRGWLTPPDRRSEAHRIFFVGAITLGALGAFKLLDLSETEPDAMNSIAALMVTILVGMIFAVYMPRVTKAGRQVIEDLKSRIPTRPATGRIAASYDSSWLPLSVALLGPSALVGTPYDAHRQAFPILTTRVNCESWLCVGSSDLNGGEKGIDPDGGEGGDADVGGGLD